MAQKTGTLWRGILAAALGTGSCSIDDRDFADAVAPRFGTAGGNGGAAAGASGSSVAPGAGAPAVSPTEPVREDGVVPAGLDGMEPVQGAANVSVEPAAVDFGRVAIGQGAPSTVVVRNAGAEPLGTLAPALSGAQASDFDAALDPACAQLAPGGTCSVTVTFAPQAAGVRTALLALSGTARAPIQIRLNGIGVPPGALVTSSAGVDFGGAEVGVSSSARSWVITNTAATPTGLLRLSAPTLSDFVVSSNTCTAPLAPAASCSVGVVYQPTATAVHNDRLVLEDDYNQAFLNLVGRGQYRLTIAKAGAGQGRVTALTGIDCGATCTGLFDAGTVPLSATTTNGSDSSFSGWTGPVDCVGPARRCSVRLDRSQTLTATFAPMTNNLVFIASGSFLPNLGSARAFDVECNRLASAAGINDASGTGYVAAVSGPASFWDRIPTAARGWVRMDGLPIGDTRTNLRGERPNVLYSVQFDENGERSEYGSVWTGTTNTGEPGDDCNGWTSVDGTVTGIEGAGRHGTFWLDSTYGQCDSNTLYGIDISMYCMGVTKSSPVTIPTFPGARRMWVTNTDYVPGSTTPDAKCNAERPVGVASARAFIGYTGRYPEESIDLTATYVRPDGHLVGTGAQIVALEMASGPWLTADRSLAFSLAWTGRGGRGGPEAIPTDTDTCLDWTTTAGQASLGYVGDDNVGAFGGAFLNTCTQTNARLYCVEL